MFGSGGGVQIPLHTSRFLRRLHPLYLFLILCAVAKLSVGIKLRFQTEECVDVDVQEPDSLVTISLVALTQENHEAFYNVKVTDPRDVRVYQKEAIDEAELSFKNRIVGKHRICLEVHKSSKFYPTPIFRDVALDIAVGETWSHDRVTKNHMDELLEHISDVSTRIQRLRSEIKHLKFREERHKKTIDSTARRVSVYALLKGVVLVAVTAVQVSVIRYFFRTQTAG